MIAAIRAGRNSIGVEIDPDYCRMAARHLKAETSNLFSKEQLIFEKATAEHAYQVKEEEFVYKNISKNKNLKKK